MANGKVASNSAFREQVFNGTKNAGHKRHIRPSRRERGRVSAPEPREIWTESTPSKDQDDRWERKPAERGTVECGTPALDHEQAWL